MTAHKGSQKQGSVYRGSARVKRAYKGSTLIYTRKVQTSASKLFNTAGTFSFALPAELRSLTVVAVGAGGGGSGGAAASTKAWWTGGAGGAGGYCRKTYTANECRTLAGKTLAATVGQAGSGGGLASAGGQGGASSFYSQTANGGMGGRGGALSAGGSGGTASGGDVNTTGSSGTKGQNLSTATPGGNGYTINGAIYGKGGDGGFPSGSNGVVGCVYIEYTYLKAVE